MIRRRTPGPAHNHERWLVSYADFITLLFAFFVVLFASSQANEARARTVSASVRRALEEGAVAAAIGQWGAGGKAPSQSSSNPPAVASPPSPEIGGELQGAMQQLSRTLIREIELGQVRLQLDPRGLVISLTQAAFFPSGTDAVDPATLPALRKIGQVTTALNHPLRLEGHTDSVPIHTPRFRSNWDLSAARAVAVLEVFRQSFGATASRMAVAGYADTVPVASNEDDAGRARNRRVDVVILNRPEPTEPEAAR